MEAILGTERLSITQRRQISAQVDKNRNVEHKVGRGDVNKQTNKIKWKGDEKIHVQGSRFSYWLSYLGHLS